jgi:hypothetical protein
MDTNKTSLPCGRKDGGEACPNPGIWQPVLLIYAPYIHGFNEPVRAALGLAVCGEHKDSAVVADFLSDEGWAQIADGFRQIGRVDPDRRRTQLAWRSYADIAAELQAARARGESITELRRRLG